MQERLIKRMVAVLAGVYMYVNVCACVYVYVTAYV